MVFHIQIMQQKQQESRDAEAIVFGLKFANNIHYKLHCSQASKARMHWARLRRHSCLSRAAISASSQVSVIFCIVDPS